MGGLKERVFGDGDYDEGVAGDREENDREDEQTEYGLLPGGVFEEGDVGVKVEVAVGVVEGEIVVHFR